MVVAITDGRPHGLIQFISVVDAQRPGGQHRAAARLTGMLVFRPDWTSALAIPVVLLCPIHNIPLAVPSPNAGHPDLTLDSVCNRPHDVQSEACSTMLKRLERTGTMVVWQ